MSRGPEPEIGTVELLEEAALHPDPIVTATELAERMDYTRQGVMRRLEQLEEEGLFESKMAGAHARCFWTTRDGKRYLDANRG